MTTTDKLVELDRTNPDPELIQKLEELLEDARAGRLLGLVFVGNFRKVYEYGRIGWWRLPDVNYALDMAKQRILDRG